MKATQILLTESDFHFIFQFRWVTILILQHHPDVAPELVKLREYGYYRNLESPESQSRYTKLHSDVPFLSGQTSSKCFKSRLGRKLSIGIQYLKTMPCEFASIGTQRNKPYRVQSILQSFLPRLATDKLLHNLQLGFTSSLESTRVMENIAGVICEDEFVLDVVLATLQVGSFQSAVTDKNKPVRPRLLLRVVPGQNLRSKVTTRNENVPSRDFPIHGDQACRPLGPPLCHKFSAELMSSLH